MCRLEGLHEEKPVRVALVLFSKKVEVATWTWLESATGLRRIVVYQWHWSVYEVGANVFVPVAEVSP
jgi:hypothetical protein